MKIIHLVLGKANPDRMNGVNKVANQLATTQKNQGYDVCLWGIANTLTHNYPGRNYPTELFQQQKNKWVLDKTLKSAINELDKDTVVHVHGSFIPEFYQVAKLLNRREIPFVYTPHGALTEGALMKNAWMKKMYFSLFESKLIKRAKAVQLLGKEEWSHMDTLIQTDNKCLIPNGQDWSVFPKVINKKTKQAYPVFGFCGRLAIFHKGLDLLLEAIRIYIDKGYFGQVELIGDGNDRLKLEEQCENLGLEEVVTFHGKKFGEEKFEIISGFDVFMHPSRMEGFPTAVLEAAAMGKPCITSEATNINDYLNSYEAGFPMKENTPETIANTMIAATEYYNSNKLQQMGARASEMVKKEFDWNEISKRLVAVYAQ